MREPSNEVLNAAEQHTPLHLILRAGGDYQMVIWHDCVSVHCDVLLFTVDRGHFTVNHIHPRPQGNLHVLLVAVAVAETQQSLKNNVYIGFILYFIMRMGLLFIVSLLLGIKVQLSF